MYDYRRGGSVLGAFLLGGITGAALGLLFAPRTGKETRDMISERAEEYWGRGVEVYDSAAEKTREVYSTSRELVAEKSDEVRTRIDEARARLQDQVAKAAEVGAEKVASAAPVLHEVVDKATGATQEALEKVAARGAKPIDEEIAATEG